RLRRPHGLVLLPRASYRLKLRATEQAFEPSHPNVPSARSAPEIAISGARSSLYPGEERSSSPGHLVRRASARSCGALVVIRPAAAEVAGAGPRGPEDQRQQDSDDAHDQEDPADRVNVDTVDGRVHGEGEHGAYGRKNQSYSETHTLLLFRGPGVLLSKVGSMFGSM